MKGKKSFRVIFSLVLAISLAMTSSAYAFLDYNNHQSTEATFETFEEARESAPEAVKQIYGSTGEYIQDPNLANYPVGTTYIYRSSGIYGGQTAAWNNTCFVVLAQQAFETKDDAKAYLESLGIIDLVEECIGSIILITPINAEKGFGQSDVDPFLTFQFRFGYPNALEWYADGTTEQVADANYYGAYTKFYMIAGDSNASTFVNNFIAPNDPAYIGRYAGIFLVGGNMHIRSIVSSDVPAYILNASDSVVEKYRLANGTDSYEIYKDKEVFYNSTVPLRRVISATTEVDENGNITDLASHIADAYYGMFINAQRLYMLGFGNRAHPIALPYSEYVEYKEAVPFPLCARNAILNGRTFDGDMLVTFVTDKNEFSDMKTEEGDYLDTWYEILPQEVIDNTAPAGSVPLFLSNHGGGDDPLMFMDTNGILEAAGREGFAIVAPMHSGIGNILTDVLPRLVTYMLAKYPALDASRVYVGGFSMGGAATHSAIVGDGSLFAGAVVMAGAFADYQMTDELTATYSAIDLPVMQLTSTFDYGFDNTQCRFADNGLKGINFYFGLNEIPAVESYDFEAYPMLGFAADKFTATTINDTVRTFYWEFNNADGIPMNAYSLTEHFTHTLYQPYGDITWDFVKHYSRNQETGAIEYSANVD